MYIPDFIYDISVARCAREFLSGELSLETFAGKYSQGLSELYSEVESHEIQEPAEQFLQFLAEILDLQFLAEILDLQFLAEILDSCIGLPFVAPIHSPLTHPVTHSISQGVFFQTVFLQN